MDLVLLRNMLHSLICGLPCSHNDIPGLCAQLRLAAPPPKESGSKQFRLATSLSDTPDSDLPFVARSLLEEHLHTTNERYHIEELLWSDVSGPKIPKRLRRDLARSMKNLNLYVDAAKFMQLIENLFIIDEDFNFVSGLLGKSRDSLRARIERHVIRNPGDMSPEDLFNDLGAYDCTDHRFVLFLEGLASSDVRPDIQEQRAFATLVNGTLQNCGVALQETGDDGGYPLYSVVPNGVSTTRPKNLIFASSVKPDLRLRDAVSNDVEIVSNADKVLVYDRPIGAEGLLWRDLQTWWAENQGIDRDRAANISLYKRLLSALPDNSPPQTHFFRGFFGAFQNQFENLPALLPEVWLHWDPRTIKERGLDALTRLRMDFLLLLPGHARVVVEIDGKLHYADDDGKASPIRYAKTMAADRDLRLRGYEVYRFGAIELEDEAATRKSVQVFFEMLFKRHGVRPR